MANKYFFSSSSTIEFKPMVMLIRQIVTHLIQKILLRKLKLKKVLVLLKVETKISIKIMI